MTHQQYKMWISAYYDGELTPEQQAELEEHLQVCAACRAEFLAAQQFESVMTSLRLQQPPEEVWSMYWTSIYNRLERGVGWILLSLGAIILLFFGAYKLVAGIIHDPSLPLVVKIGLLSFLAGVVVLLVSFLREKLFFRQRERYKEVQQ